MTALALNFTGLFGIVQWDGYIGTGVWSIGNELVFYLFFPLFVLLTKANKPLFYLLSLFLAIIFFYFAFEKLDIHQTLSDKDQWSMYVNPLNQVFLFLSGYLMGHYLTKYIYTKLQTLLLFILALGTFIFYSPVGENVAAGMNRIVLSTVCFLICLAFYKNTFRFPSIIDRLLTVLGEASYSVYLLHPLVWIFLQGLKNRLSLDISVPLQIMLTVLATVVISFLNYKYFETFFIRLGKKISKRFDRRVAAPIQHQVREK